MHWRLNNALIDLKYYLHCIIVICFVMILSIIEFALFILVAKAILTGA